MTQPDHDAPSLDCILETIMGFMLPFFLVAAAGNQDTAKTVIKQLVDAYNASTPMELDLVGRVIGFSVASMDNLRLSMTPGLSDTKVLRYRCNAVTLSRASDQALKVLEALQARQAQALKIPRPAVAAAPGRPPVAAAPGRSAVAAAPGRSAVAAAPGRSAVAAAPGPISPASVPPHPVSSPVAARQPVPSGGHALPAQKPLDIEAMKRDARLLMGSFSKHGVQSGVAFPVVPDPSRTVDAAARQAVAAARRT